MDIFNSFVQIKNAYYLNVHEGAQLHIDPTVAIEPFASIICGGKIIIEKGTLISSGVRIVDFDHAIPSSLEEKEKIAEKGKSLPIHIGKYCWIGSNAVILKGVTLGDGCIVGAGAVVTKSFPSGSIVTGVPANIKKLRW